MPFPTGRKAPLLKRFVLQALALLNDHVEPGPETPQLKMGALLGLGLAYLGTRGAAGARHVPGTFLVTAFFFFPPTGTRKAEVRGAPPAVAVSSALTLASAGGSSTTVRTGGPSCRAQ